MTSTLDPELLAAVSHSVEVQLGLFYPPERSSDLERGLRGAAADLGFNSVEECARALVLAQMPRAQIAALAVHLTIGETYFFREPAAFEALASQLLPALIQERRGHSQRLRIWSAGCCTGEEPYSIAIALRRAIPDIDDWRITILATDINPRFLHKAVAGVYGEWSFRGVPAETRNAWFRRTPERRFEILPSIRKMVTFACLNLVEDVYPSLANDTNALDLIVCRNVIMYFSRPQMQSVVEKFRRSLAADGALLVSATEAARELFVDFGANEIPGVALYRKGVPKGPATTVEPARPSAPIVSAEPQPQPRPPEVRPPPPAPIDHAAEARRLANEGHLRAALEACERAIAADKLVAAHHYLRGIILQEEGVLDEAAAAFRRALYLDPDFAIVHFTLGHLLLRQDRGRDAARCFANARSLLAHQPPEAVLPESDGITAGRLLAIITSMEEAFA